MARIMWALVLLVALGASARSVGTFCPQQRFTVTLLMNMNKDAAQYFQEVLDAVSAPGSPTRGSYLSPAQVSEVMRVHDSAVAAVQLSLRTRGLGEVQVSPWSDVLSLNTTFAQLKRAFPNIQCRELKKGGSRCDVQPLPADLREYVAHVILAPVKPVLASCAKPLRSRRSTSSNVCNGGPDMPPYFPLLPAYLNSPWAINQQQQQASTTLIVLPRCFKNDQTAHIFVDQFPAAYASTNLFQNVTKEHLCGASGSTGTALANVTLVFTNMDDNSNHSITDTDISSTCSDLTYPMCINSTAQQSVEIGIVQCFVQVSLNLVPNSRYTLMVTATLANGSSYSAPVCVYSGNTTACNNKIFVPQAPVLPDHVRGMYSVPPTLNGSGTQSTQAVVTVHPPGVAYYSDADVSQFQTLANTIGFTSSSVTFVSMPGLTQFALNYATGTAQGAQRALYSPLKSIVQVSQARNQSATAETVTADVEWLSAMGQGVQTYVFHSGYFRNLYDIYPNCFFCEALDVLMAVQYGAIVPSVITISSFYVEGCEMDTRNPLRAYAENLFRTFGVMGVSVISASGDQGAHPSCDTVFVDLPTATYQEQCRLTSTYPASSVFVTAVGGTQHIQTCTAAKVCTMQEVPASLRSTDITSGGGFSFYDYRANWQDAVVTAYLANTKDTTMFPVTQHIQTNHSGYPDVALLATPMQIVLDGKPVQFIGTAASAASFAGMIALVNAELERNGKARLGFLNPFLYSAPANVFNDITVGDNSCVGAAGAQDFCCTLGYPAAPGWDPITGLGSVNFPNLLSYALRTQPAKSNSTVSPFTPAPVFPTRAPTHATTGNAQTVAPVAPVASSSSSGSSFDAHGFLIAMPVMLGLCVAASFFVYAHFFAPKSLADF